MSNWKTNSGVHVIKHILSLKYTCSLNMPFHIHAEQSHQVNLKKEKNKTKERKGQETSALHIQILCA
ncbi:hypothetical protein Peur_064836 [Populus x canadensis]|jgi:hypothetical protein